MRESAHPSVGLWARRVFVLFVGPSTAAPAITRLFVPRRSRETVERGFRGDSFASFFPFLLFFLSLVCVDKDVCVCLSLFIACLCLFKSQ